MHKPLIYASLLLLLLVGCVPSPSVPRVVLSDAGIEGPINDASVELLENCDGPSEIGKTITRKGESTIEAGVSLSAEIRQIITGEIYGRYQDLHDETISVALSAPPGTNMAFTIVWKVEVWGGTVDVDDQRNAARYRLNVPISGIVRSENIGCAAQAGAEQNLAPLGSVAASSQFVSGERPLPQDCYAPGKVADQRVGGDQPENWGRLCSEWATQGEAAGAWVMVTFKRAYFVRLIRLYDRPNPSDHILGGYIELSDGTQIPVPALANGGTAVDLPVNREISWARLVIQETSRETLNIGLAEIEVIGTEGRP